MISKLSKGVLICSAALTGSYYINYPSWYKTYKFTERDLKTLSEDKAPYIYLPESYGNDIDECMEASSVFWRKNVLPQYWKLLMLCKSKHHKVRLKAVESLSKLTSLEKWQYIIVAQACDVNTAVGLARYNTSPYFFLLPPFRDLDKGNLQNELYQILSSLPFSSTDICLQNLVYQVLKSSKLLSKNEYYLDLDGDPSLIYHSQKMRKAVFLYNKFCLEVILACSAKSSYRNAMMEKGILQVLLKVLHFHKDDVEIHSLIAQTLANLSMEGTLRNSIFRTGWIGLLSEWKKSPYISINLPAAKALANLDNDDILHPIYEDGIYVLSPLCRLSSQKHVSADVIFIHGLLGATFWTWRQCDSLKIKPEPVAEMKYSNNVTNSTKYTMCWPKDWLAVDIPSIRIISADYKSFISNWGSYCPQTNEKDSTNKRARELMKKLLLANVGERPIIWIAHSMGGIIVKQILVEAFESNDEKIQSLLKRTVGFIFYSVPHRGSDLASKINSASLIFQPSSEIGELKKDSPSLLSLHEKFKAVIQEHSIPVLSFGELNKFRWGLNISVLVPLDSANPGFGEFYTLPVDHLSTCKPMSPTSPEYVKVLNFLKGILNRPIVDEHYHKKSFSIYEISKIMSLIQ